MKKFLRGGRGMAVGQNDKVMKLPSYEAFSFCPIVNQNNKFYERLLLPLWRYRSDVLLMIFCVLFSNPDLLGARALAQSPEHRDKVVNARGQDVSRINFGDKLETAVKAVQESHVNGVVDSLDTSPVMVGYHVPKEFWDIEHLVYENGDTSRRSLGEYKGKLVIIDFWATWCAICLAQMKATESLVSKYPNNVKLLFVNPAKTKDNYEKINAMQEKLKEMSLNASFTSIIEDDYLIRLFPSNAYPKYAWIGPNGGLIALTTSLSVTEGHIDQILNLLKMNDNAK